MTREELKSLIVIAQSAFPRSEVIKGQEGFDVWYECTQHMDYELAKQAMIEAIKQCEYPPVIANLCKAYDEIKEVYDAKMRNLREYYEIGGGMYPGSSNYDSEDAFKVFKDLTIGLAKGDMDKALKFAAQLSHKCIDEYKALEEQSLHDEELSKNFPNYFEKLKEIRESVKKKYEQRS